MAWLLEDPRPILFGGVAIELMLLVALVKTGRAAVLGSMAGVAAVVVALLFIERIIETDMEQVDRQLHYLAERLLADDVETVRAALLPGSPASAAAERALTQFRVTEARLSGLEIKTRGPRDSRQATASFFAHIQVRPRQGALDMDRAVRRMDVELRRENDRWLVIDYRDRGLDVSDEVAPLR